MYIPKYFQSPDHAAAVELMKSNPFATVITVQDGIVNLNHLPILVQVQSDQSIVLLGHLARANPQSKQFASGGEVTIVFHGPHTYITPSWYSERLNVPTWNYAVVHARGRVQLMEDPAALNAILEQTVNESERFEKTPWKYELPEDFTAGMLKAIVGFKIEVTHLEGKFKLSQNRSEIDRQGVLDGLKQRTDDQSAGVLKWMQRVSGN